MEIYEVEELYTVLKERKSDYVISGPLIDYIHFLSQECMSNTNQLFFYLGGPILWLTHFWATKRSDRKRGITPLDRKIIRILTSYEITIKKGYAVMVKKEDSM